MNVSDTVIGALIALSGVLLTQVSVQIADWIRSSRERKQAQRDRELSLKRDIYVPLVHAFTEGVNLLIAIPQAHHSKLTDLRLSQAAQNALAAKDLIASDRVMSAVNIAANQLAQGTMRLLTLKLDEATLSIDLDHLSTRINELNADNRLSIDRMRVLQDAGALRPEATTALDLQFQHNQTELKSLFTEHQEKFATKNAALKELHVQMTKELQELTAVSAHAVIEIRCDLDIPTNAEAIMSRSRESQRFIGETLPAFIDEIWRKVTNKVSKRENRRDGI